MPPLVGLLVLLAQPPQGATGGELPWCEHMGQANCAPVLVPRPPPLALPTPTEVGVRKVLRDSAEAWSRGDLDGFMDAYERGPATTFVTSSGLVRGWDAMRDRYRRRYGDGAALGALTFSDLEVRPLGPDYAIAYGRFHLRRPGAAAEDTGVFDLVMRATPQGWRIVSDHTS